ncbi:MAG: hypothetical protein CME59_16120 [Halioglobus sp.]|nr:hypothetical protein [Halioglobus sp.]|tara:strand:+ start:8360 stop:8671 length:312 start_codon:yes stop_codon:yes gene_type:complete
MPIDECYHCGNNYHWSWTEAFEKFGFMDGDGQIQTHDVEDVLIEAGYEVKLDEWGLHNLVIISIKKNGIELIPHDDPKVTFGYDDPHDYLPAEIVQLLDEKLP